MYYQTVQQGSECEQLKPIWGNAKAQIEVWERHVKELNEKLDTEKWRLDSFKKQAERHNDYEGFEPNIRAAEKRIEDLERQISKAQEKVRNFRNQADEADRRMSKLGCPGYV